MAWQRRQVLGALGASALAWPLASRAQRSNRLILGQSAAFSGPAAQLGIELNRGAKLCFDAFNAAGGLNGTTIEIQALDDGYDPERCKANTAKLLSQDVFALFGYVGTPTSLAAMPLVREGRTPFFAPFTGAMALREPMLKQVFHVRASYDDETALIVRHLTSVGLKRIAVFRQNDSYGQAGLDGVQKALSQQSLSPVAVGTVERNSVEVASAVQAIVAAQPNAVVLISAYKSCAAFIRAAKAAGYGGTFYNVSFVGTQALADELGAAGNGVAVSQVMPSPFNQKVPIVREYLEQVRKTGGTARPNYSGIEGYISARVFIEGLKRARSVSGEGLVAGLESLKGLSLGGFSLDFSPSSRVASRFVDLAMLDGRGGVARN